MNLKHFTRIFGTLALATALTAGLSACSTTAPEAMCGYVVGNGSDDRNLHKVLWPGDAYTPSSNEIVQFVPCNSRNYLITKTDSGFGDRQRPTDTFLSDGTPVAVTTETYFTLNQNEGPLKAFRQVCLKYVAADGGNCLSDSAEGGTANFATAGWNGMLAENFGSTLDQIVPITVRTYGQEVLPDDPDKRAEMGKALSAKFKAELRSKFGYTDDMFCGNSSKWTGDGPNADHSNFDCTDVRINVTGIEKRQLSANEVSTSPQVALNQQAYQEALARYGSPEAAAKWLGTGDVVDKCKAAGVPCSVIVGDDGRTG